MTPASFSLRKAVGTMTMLVVLSASLSLGLMSSRLFGGWTGTTSGSQSVTGGTVTLNAIDGTNSNFATTISNFAGGDTATRYVEITNGGTLSFASVTVAGQVGTVSDSTAPTATQAQFISDVKMQVYAWSCSSGTYAFSTSTGPSCTAGSGSWSAAVAFTPGAGSMGSAATASASTLAANGKLALKIVWNVCDANNVPSGSGCTTGATSDLMGASATYTFQFGATQRTSTSTL